MKISKKTIGIIKKVILIISLFVILLIISVPILVFFTKFSGKQLSIEMTDWGAFGSYVGGVTGSLISFLSLVVLAYITYIVAKNSNKENRKLFIFKKRIEAYDELLKFAPRLNSISIVSFPKNWTVSK